MRKIFSAASLGLTLTLSVSSAEAETTPPERVSVLTMGPGDHPFARFGHNAILLEWPNQERAVVYNFGTFAFDGLSGVRDFMAGRFRYWLSVSTLPRTLRFYARQQRSLVAQELALSPAERLELATALEENAEPEHRYYDYDYYLDNCSTRVRDALDRLLHGELGRKLKEQPGRLSFREHTERLTADAGALYFGLDLALGPLTDRPTTRWNDLFVPSELHAALAQSTRSEQGREVPLVRAERVFLTADRSPMRSEPPFRSPAFGAVGVALGGVLALLGRAANKQRLARVVFGAITALLGLVLGLLGSIFVVFWAFTKHWAAYRNENILVCPPWALALLVFGVGLALGRPRSRLRAHRLLTWSAASALLALLLSWIPSLGQDNTRTAALLAPLWLGMYLGSAWLSGLSPWPKQFARRTEPG
ncbi:MAG TPA: DUF4105 domain-containing protein [Polyangiaceae bacterium]|nr:DUF4105 domain-containing protein [Polyangiaceae bacterium]